MEEDRWTLELETEDGALLSVWGTGPSDVWAVGGHDRASLLLHFDGQSWQTAQAPGQGALWSVYGFSRDDVYAVGDAGLILHFDGSNWQKIASPTQQTLYGVWGQDSDNVWLVGGDITNHAGEAVILRGNENGFDVVEDLPAELVPSTLFKIYDGPQGLMAVGSEGAMLSYDGEAWSTESKLAEDAVFSLWGRGDGEFYTVGGQDRGELLHFDGSDWQRVMETQGGLSGVFTAPDHPTIAVGAGGLVLEVFEDNEVNRPQLPGWQRQPWLHGVWGDGTGTVYAVGGRSVAYPWEGVLYRRN
jgi:hypothetical protein